VEAAVASVAAVSHAAAARPVGHATAAATPRAITGDERWDPLLVSVAGYILTAVGRIHQLFPPLEALHVAAITGLLAIGLFLFDTRADRQLRAVLVPTTRLAAALTLWMMVSVGNAINISNSFDLVFNNFVKTALISVVIAASVRSMRDVERLVLVYFIGAVLYSTVVITRFDLGTGEAWRLGRLYYYDANDFATFIVTALPLGIYFAHAGRTMRIRVFAMVGLALLTLAFVRSGSRGGFIALFVVVGFVVLRFAAIPLRWRLTATAFVAVTLVLTASDQYWEQMQTITSDSDYNHTSESGRLQIWSRGVDYMLQNPVLGVGPGNFSTAEGTLSLLAERQQYGIGVRWNAPHNSFLQIAAELGIPGLALYLAMLACAFGAVKYDTPLTPALTASLLGFVVGSFFLSLAYSEMLYTLVALAVGVQKVSCALPS
jgi:O-antigen ligase